MVELLSATDGEGLAKGGSSYLMDGDGNINETLAADAAKLLKDSGGNVLGRLDEDSRPTRVARVALAAVDTGGGLFAWQNPESVAVIVDKVELDVTTASTGACTVDVGSTATSAATSSDNLLDGLDVNAAAGVFDNITDKGTNGKSRQKVAAGKWVTGSKASGATAGIVGFAYIHYHLV